MRALEFAQLSAPLLAGALCARALLAYAPARIAPDRAQPLVVVTAWGWYGTVAFALLAGAIVAATFVLARTLRRGDDRPIDLRAILASAGLALLACSAWPFVFSSDVYAYAAYGDLATRGLSPYRGVPPSLHDAILNAADFQWSGPFPPCVYGPAFVWLARELVAAATALGWSVAQTLWLLRASSDIAFLGAIACADRALAAIDPVRRRRVLAGCALNPVVLWCVAEGHNDAEALLCVCALAALARGVRRLPGWSTLAVLPLALIVKASAGVAVLGFVLDDVLVRRRDARTTLLATFFGTACAVALALPPLLPALRSVARHGKYTPSVSVAGLLGLGPALAFAALLTVIALAVLARGKRSGHAWLGLALFAVLPNPYPWYGLWFVPLAAAGGRSPAATALAAVTICALLRYLPDAFGTLVPSASLALSTLVVVPILLAFGGVSTDLARPSKDRLAP